ncbi:MAG: hypothetical protein NTX22_07475 [Ignavibacteriales bacterium]|nr:hypothetical protein [Ignavibacteriales bacterium]
MNSKNVGISILIIGLVMTLYTGYNYVTREKIVEVAGIQITKEKDHSESWSPFIGIGVMVIGGIVFTFSKKNNPG